MIDLNSPSITPEIREKAINWENLPYVRKGLLTLWDAANLLSPDSYGGIYQSRSTVTQLKIQSIYDALCNSVSDSYNPPKFMLRYEPKESDPLKEETWKGIKEMYLYTGTAFLRWIEVVYKNCYTFEIDDRYFERYRYALELEDRVKREEVPSPFSYNGRLKLDKKSERYKKLATKGTMTTLEFAQYYYKISLIDEKTGTLMYGYDSTDEFLKYIFPLLKKIQEEIYVDDDVKF